MTQTDLLNRAMDAFDSQDTDDLEFCRLWVRQVVMEQEQKQTLYRLLNLLETTLEGVEE